jgi:hypothetical protein
VLVAPQLGVYPKLLELLNPVTTVVVEVGVVAGGGGASTLVQLPVVQV